MLKALSVSIMSMFSVSVPLAVSMRKDSHLGAKVKQGSKKAL